MHLDDPVCGAAGLLVQFVDVLRDQRMQLAAALQFHQCQVAAVGLRRPRRMRKAAAPGGLPHLRVGQVVLQGRLFLGSRVGAYAIKQRSFS